MRRTVRWVISIVSIGASVATIAGAIYSFYGPSQAPLPVKLASSGKLALPKIYNENYDNARKLLISHGWIPQNKHWTHGDSEEAKAGNGPIFWSRGYHELESCSGNGYANCLFKFTDGMGGTLVVVTAGEEAEDGSYKATVERISMK